MQESRVGYIGLGAMGGAIALRLAKAAPLSIWDADAGVVARFAKNGATSMRDAAELGRHCDIIFLCLPRSSDVEQVLFSNGGLMDGLKPGALIVDQTSGTPGQTYAIAQRLRSAGIRMLDAPISGTPSAAAAGQCTLLVSGSDEDVEALRHCFRAITAKVLRCGDRVGDGQATKLVNNTINAGCRLSTLEMVALGRKLGLDLAGLTDTLNQGEGRNRPAQLMLTALVEQRASTNFALRHMLKDINQSVRLGMELGAAMPIAGIVRGILQIGCNTIGESAQLEDVVSLTESMSSARLTGSGETNTLSSSDRESLHRLVDRAVASCNRWVTFEALAMGLQYGLSLEKLVPAIQVSSGWSGAVDSLAGATSLAAICDPEELSTELVHLRVATDLAVDEGVSILVMNEVRSRVEELLAGVGIPA